MSWSGFVKAFSVENGMSYREALSDDKCRREYHKSKGLSDEDFEMMEKKRHEQKQRKNARKEALLAETLKDFDRSKGPKRQKKEVDKVDESKGTKESEKPKKIDQLAESKGTKGSKGSKGQQQLPPPSAMIGQPKLKARSHTKRG